MKKGLLFLLALCCLAVLVLAAETSFSDVPENHWARGPVEQAAAEGVVTGYADGSFRPDNQVTAAQFCAFLSRSVLADALAAEPEELPWQTRSLNACAPALAGTSVERSYQSSGGAWGDFVNRPLARYDMVQMLYNLLKEDQREYDREDRDAAEKALDDWGNIPHGYRDAVIACYRLNLMRGQTDGRFNGNASVTRAQSCVVLARLRDLLRDVPAELAEAAGLPVFGMRDGETAQRMMQRINPATPLHPEGSCLSNGKEVTEENLQELLEIVQAACPDGTVWSKDPRFDYNSPKMGPSESCLSFGFAVSDFLFGEDAKVKQNWSWRGLQPGDLIHVKSNGIERIVFLTKVDSESKDYTAFELRAEGKLRWGVQGNLKEFIDDELTQVYKRY